MRELKENEVIIDQETNETVLPSGKRHSLEGKEKVFVKLDDGEYEHGIEAFNLGEESVVVFDVEPGIGLVEIVDCDRIYRISDTVN